MRGSPAALSGLFCRETIDLCLTTADEFMSSSPVPRSWALKPQFPQNYQVPHVILQDARAPLPESGVGLGSSPARGILVAGWNLGISARPRPWLRQGCPQTITTSLLPMLTSSPEADRSSRSQQRAWYRVGPGGSKWVIRPRSARTCARRPHVGGGVGRGRGDVRKVLRYHNKAMRWSLARCLLCRVITVAGAAMPAAGQSVEVPATLSAPGCGGARVELGLRFYRAKGYGAARVEFEAAHGLSGDAELLHNLSWTAEKQGEIAAAIDYEERFRSKVRSCRRQEPDQAQGRLVRLRELQARGGGAWRRRVSGWPLTTTATAAATAAVATGDKRQGAAVASCRGAGAGWWRGRRWWRGLACGGATIRDRGAASQQSRRFTLREIRGVERSGRGAERGLRSRPCYWRACADGGRGLDARRHSSARPRGAGAAARSL